MRFICLLALTVGVSMCQRWERLPHNGHAKWSPVVEALPRLPADLRQFNLTKSLWLTRNLRRDRAEPLWDMRNEHVAFRNALKARDALRKVLGNHPRLLKRFDREDVQAVIMEILRCKGHYAAIAPPLAGGSGSSSFEQHFWGELGQCDLRMDIHRKLHCTKRGETCVRKLNWVFSTVMDVMDRTNIFRQGMIWRRELVSLVVKVNVVSIHPPQPVFFAAVAVYALLVLLGLATLGSGVVADFWKRQKGWLVLLVAAICGLILMTSYYVILTQGYARPSPEDRIQPVVAEQTAQIIFRVGATLFVFVFILFTFFLTQAVIGARYAGDEQRKKRRFATAVVAGVFGFVALALLITTVLLAVYGQRPTPNFILDVSAPLFAGVSLLFASSHIVLFLYMARHSALSEDARRNARFFLAGAIVVVAIFAARFVVVCLWMWSDWEKYLAPLRALDAVSNACMAIAIMLYVGVPIITDLKSRSETDSYAQSAHENANIPLMQAYDV